MVLIYSIMVGWRFRGVSWKHFKTKRGSNSGVWAFQTDTLRVFGVTIRVIFPCPGVRSDRTTYFVGYCG